MASRAGSGVWLALRSIVVSAAFISLWTWLASMVRAFDPHPAPAWPAWFRLAGGVIAGGGLALAAACIATFAVRGDGTPAPFDPPRRFVAKGPYRFTRNPMYVGAAATIAGAGLVLGSPSIVVLAAAFLIVAHVFVVAYEEPALTRRFGDDYRAYRANVPRWGVRTRSRRAD